MRNFEWTKTKPGFYMTEEEALGDLCLADPSKNSCRFGANRASCWALHGGSKLFYYGKTKKEVEEWAENHASEIRKHFWDLQEHEQEQDQDQEDYFVSSETTEHEPETVSDNIVSDKTIAPTEKLYSACNLAFEHFNRLLFDGSLSPVILTFSLKNPRALGFYHHNKWQKVVGEDLASEISLNPDSLKDRTLKEVLSTLVHEMVHHWQYEFGEPSRPGYHDREWADKMLQIGLHPSNTGQPGGRKTGQSISHFIIADGAFEDAFNSLPLEAALPWTTAFGASVAAKKKPASKVSYSCGCRHFQAKTGLKDLLCTVCGNEFVSAQI